VLIGCAQHVLVSNRVLWNGLCNGFNITVVRALDVLPDLVLGFKIGYN
jgi:hypothetical protein